MLIEHPLTIDEVNNLLSESFIRIFGNIVEHFPPVAIRILKKRPFGNVDDILEAVLDYLDSLNLNEKEYILQQYPDILMKLAYFSTLEKEIIGSDHLSVEEKRKLTELNNRYKDKFGFPFVIASKDKDVQGIFTDILHRLENDKDKEIQVAIGEIKTIVKLKLFELVR